MLLIFALVMTYPFELNKQGSLSLQSTHDISQGVVGSILSLDKSQLIIGTSKSEMIIFNIDQGKKTK